MHGYIYINRYIMRIYIYKHNYNMHKHINKNADIIQVQWNNHPWTGNIYNKLSNAKQTWGAHSVK